MQALNEKHTGWLQSVLAKYGLDAVSVIPLVSTQQERSGYKVHSRDATVYVKPVPRQKIGLESFEKRLQLVSDRDIPAMPHYYKTQNGRFVATMGSTKFVVSEWIEGHPLSVHASADVFWELGHSFGLLHQIPAPAFQVVDVRREGTMYRQLHRRFVLSVPNYQGVAKQWMQRHRTTFMKMAETALTTLGQRKVQQVLELGRSSPRLIHGNVRPESLLLYNGSPFVHGWHHVRPGLAHVEVAQILLDATGCQTASIQAFLGGYEETRSLTSSDKQLIFALFSFPYEAWEMVRKPTGIRAEQHFEKVKNNWLQRQQAWAWLRVWATP